MANDEPITHLREEIESKSSVLAKLPRDRRRLLDQALVDHDPASYRAVFSKFRLADFGISFTAFYRYARRIRHQADLLDLAEIALPKDADIPAAVHSLVSHRLIESLLHDDPSPRTLQRLTDAYRVATNTMIALHRQKELMKAAVWKAREHDADCFRSATAAFSEVLQDRLAAVKARSDASPEDDRDSPGQPCPKSQGGAQP